MTRASDKLLPCPFCGRVGAGYDDAAMGHSLCYCPFCGAQGPEKPDDAKAADAWNTRASQRADNLNPEALGELYEALEGLLACVRGAPGNGIIKRADAAIRKARGEQS